MTHVTTAPIGGIYRYKSGGLKGGPYTYDDENGSNLGWVVYQYRDGTLAIEEKNTIYMSVYDVCKWMTQSWLNVYFPNFEFPWQVKEF